MSMTFRKSWDFDQGNRMISLNDLRDDADTLEVLQSLGLGVTDAEIAADLRDTGTTIGAALAAELAELPPPTLPAINHGAVSGALSVDCDSYGLHEVNLTGDLSITPTGVPGSNAAVRVTGAGALTLVGVTVDGRPLEIPGVLLLTRWASGWRASAVQFPVEVTPLAPTVGATSITIPAVTGVTYKINGTVAPAGVNGPYESETVTVTAEPASDNYFFPAGATDEWGPFTFLGWATIIEDTFTAADATQVSGRTASPGPGVWPSMDPLLTIVSNKAKWTEHSVGVSASFANPAYGGLAEDNDCRWTIDYDMNTDVPNGSDPLFAVLIRYNNAGVDQTTYINLQRTTNGFGADGLCDISCSRDGAAAPALVPESGQVLTGHPGVGTLEVTTVGKVIQVRLNGVLIATATSTQNLHNSQPGVRWYNRYPKADRVKIEYFG